jgi:hypothetical protein
MHPTQTDMLFWISSRNSGEENTGQFQIPFYENYIQIHFGDRIPRRVSNCSLLSFSALSSNLLSFFFTISQNTTDTSGKTKAIKKRYHGKA